MIRVFKEPETCQTMSVNTRKRIRIEGNGDSPSGNREGEDNTTSNKCDQCHRDDFRNRRGLNQHIRRMHTNKRLRSEEGEGSQNAAEGTSVIAHDESEEDTRVGGRLVTP